MKNSKVIIIGGGVAGFTAGIYLQNNGYETEILEKNAVAGGACIGWERSGCYIDGCIHWLTGVNKDNDLNKIWRDTHALTDDTKVFIQDELQKNIYGDKSFFFYADADKMEKELIAFAPEDEKEIKKLTKLIRRFQTINPPALKPVDLMNLGDLLKVAFTMAGDYIFVNKTSRISCKDIASRFKNKVLADMIADFMAADYNFMSMLYMLGHISAGDGGIPEGGSLAMVQRMEQRYLSLGGKIRKGVTVEKVIVENSCAKGVLLKKGETLLADWVVSTVPVEHCFKDLLQDAFHDKKFDERLADEKTYPIYTFTTAVIKCPKILKDNSLCIKKYLDEPIVMDREYHHLAFRNYSYDETVKGADDSVIIQATVQSNDGMYYWWKKHKNDGTYKEEKRKVGEKFLEIAKTVYPEAADQMQVIDVVTPCTYERYLNSRHGAFQGFVHTSKGKSLMQNGRIKGLNNFILAGQYIIQSGGLPPAAMSGRFAAQRICHSDKKKFVDF